MGGGGGVRKKKLLALTPAETKILVLLSAAVERFGVSRIRDFFGMVGFCLVVEFHREGSTTNMATP